jgi:hypothetical protein
LENFCAQTTENPMDIQNCIRRNSEIALPYFGVRRFGYEILNEQMVSSDNASDLCSGDTEFESQPENRLSWLRFSMKSSVFWAITPCSPLKVSRLHFQGRRVSQVRNQLCLLFAS